MVFKVLNISALYLTLVSSIVYGIFVYIFVSSWSFDYEAVVETIKYFQQENLSYLSILAFNSFSTYVLTKIMYGYEAEFIASLFFGVCASLRFFVYALLLRTVWFIPVFSSMAIMIDFNMSRYSFAITIFVLIFGVLRFQKFSNLGILKIILISPLFFHLHHFSLAFIGLLSDSKLRSRIIIICTIPIFIVLLEETFSRFLSKSDDPFPRISLIYFVLTTVLFIGPKISKLEIRPLLTVILLLFALHLAGIEFNSAYYTRFAFISFDVTLLVIAIRNTAFHDLGTGLVFSNKYVKVLLVCVLSAAYQIILINGNIWRFFE